MDFLASVNLEDLPEQQTRVLHLMQDNPEFQLRLGYDACCTCGTAVGVEAIRCRNCKRVKYCSEGCREQDANPNHHQWKASTSDDQDEQETAMGHTAIVCSVLNLCNDDEAVEAGEQIADASRFEAAQDRIRSEYESYPATLANVIAEGTCYQTVLQNCSSRPNKTLVIHIVGASEDAELSQGPTIKNNDKLAVINDYAEALADLADNNRLETIMLVFVGPECPTSPWEETTPIKNLDRHVGNLKVQTLRGIYDQKTLSSGNDVVIPAADIIFLPNPGFTVPDYEDWAETLRDIPAGTPFLCTTNTEMEGIADAQYLLDQDKIQTLPPGLADIFGVYSTGDASSSFFAVNPFAGLRVRQNDSMANDLYVKNRWMLGGIFGSFDPSAEKGKEASKRIKAGNSKSTNPALI
jgi:hypothetical protein